MDEIHFEAGLDMEEIQFEAGPDIEEIQLEAGLGSLCNKAVVQVLHLLWCDSASEAVGDVLSGESAGACCATSSPLSVIVLGQHELFEHVVLTATWLGVQPM